MSLGRALSFPKIPFASFAFFFASFASTSLQLPAQTRPVSAQMGVKVSPDSVTIGDPILLILRVRVKPGFVAEFPQMPDSTTGVPSRIAIVGQPLIERAPNDSLEFRATYRLTAWDTGPQAIPLTDIHITGPEGTGFLPLRAIVFVKSVLPLDSSLRVPKPPRDRFPVHKINWWPLIILAIAAALAGLLWWIYRQYRARRAAPRDPHEVAITEFNRVEALQLPQKGEPEQHALLMSETMRVYLAAKVDSASISDTPRQMVHHVLGSGLGDERVREILGEAELLKFAKARTSPGVATHIGQSARAIVELVEGQLAPKPDAESKAA